MTENDIDAPAIQGCIQAPFVSSRRTRMACGLMRQSGRSATKMSGFAPHFGGRSVRVANTPRAKRPEMPLKGDGQNRRALARRPAVRRFLNRRNGDLNRVPRIRGGEGA